VLDHIPGDPELRQAWNRLALGMEQPEVFYTFEWVRAVCSAYREQMTPLVFLGYEGDTLVGAVALARKNKGDVVFMAADTADYCDFLSDPIIRPVFIQEVLSALRVKRVSSAVFTNLPADSASAAALSSACANAGYHLHARPAYECARVVFGDSERRTEVKQALLARKRFRRNIRELQKRGGLTLQHETSAVAVERLLPAFIRAHIARFLETGKISSLIREDRRVFLRELAREMSDEGWIAFSRLLVGDITAAWNYGFRFGGSWFWYQPTVNDLFGDFSPGYCLLAKIVESSCDSQEIRLVDLGLGAEGYKDRFATDSRRTLYCELHSSLLMHSRAIARYRAASLATSSPKIEKRLRGAIGVAKDLRSRLGSRNEGSLKRLTRMVRRSLFHVDNILFFEWPHENRSFSSSSTHLRQLDSDKLGSAALQYGNDPASLRFLMRSAQRLRSGLGLGYVLVTAEDMPVHFCWACDFEGFQMAELNRTLKAPCQNAVMIFDCFTPHTARGHGFFGDAISLLAQQLTAQGKSAWIFGAATNSNSVHGIQKTGFQYRFTLGRRRILLLNQVKDSAHPAGLMKNESTVSTS
jgi:CelD/BcsL family acetyltransferase involved in cellulose biosynthesis